MQQSSTELTPEFVTVFARQRHQLLRHADAVLSPEDVTTDIRLAEKVPRLSKLLAASLEEMKVAEEELLDQHLQLLTAKAESDRTIAFFKALFDLVPAPLIVTAMDGTIRRTNAKAASLLLRDPYFLEGKPVAALVPKDARTDFRQQLRRLPEVGAVSDWQFTMERYADVPVRVSATVESLPASVMGAPALYWALRPL